MQPHLLFPEDRSFFRDARPMSSDTGSGGHGARWPDPSQIFAAIHGALYQAFPQIEWTTVNGKRQPKWEHLHPTGRNGIYPDRGNEPQRFGSLTTAGPFPCQWDNGRNDAPKWRWFFPCPADVVLAEGLNKLYPIEKPGGWCDLPAPLKYSLGNPCPPTKLEPAPWWSREAWQTYLAGTPLSKSPPPFRQTEDLYTAEWTTGIGMDSGTQAQDGERIYSAQYLRLHEDVAFGFAAAMPMNGADALDKLWLQCNSVVFGGQQCRGRVFRPEAAPRPNPSAEPIGEILPNSVTKDVGTGRVKWTLLTPAVFPFIPAREMAGRKIDEHPGGWLPNWIAPRDGFADPSVQAGQVLLKPHRERERGEDRQAWRDAIRKQSFIRAFLVAACVPKPIYISGWSDRKHLSPTDPGVTKLNLSTGSDPRPGYYAVPAGAAYYFQVAEGEDPHLLVDLLSWHGQDSPDPAKPIRRRSTLFGEQGFGLGVCSSWDFFENAVKPHA